LSRPLRNSFWYGITGVLATVGVIIFWILKIFYVLDLSQNKNEGSEKKKTPTFAFRL